MSTQFWFTLCFPGLPLLALYFFCRKLAKAKQLAERPFHNTRRLPGHSLSQRADKQWETFTGWLSTTIFASIIPWLVFTLTGGDSITLPLLIGALTAPFCLWKMWLAYESLPNWWLGIRGEQYVGAELDSIRNDDLKVFHDVVITDPKGNWNIDHVIVSRAGIFAVETKTRRKKVDVSSPRHKLSFDGHKVNFPDGSYDTDSVKQAIRQAQWLEKEAMNWSGGIAIPVTPLLTFPGWWVDITGKGEVTVINPKQIRSVVTGRPRVLDDRSWNILLKRFEALTTVQLPEEVENATSSPKRKKELNNHNGAAGLPSQ
ncbi:MAG: nuclease-related domain-containing protein [Verrucomicrobiales bacterium]|nr:nuclease-related domain-containing protein [Verrucomicrobiales bacterium]